MNRFVVIALAAALVLAAAGTWLLLPSKPEPEPASAQKPPAAQQVAPAGRDHPPAPDAAPSFATPAFDVVRINRAGNAVIAGRAAPGASVTVRVGTTEIGTVVADERGEWVLVPEAPLTAGPRTLSLTSRLPDGTVLESKEVVVIVVPERIESDDQVLALVTPRDAVGASRLLQGRRVSGDPALGDGLRLDTVDYDDLGQVVLSGGALPAADLRVRVDGVVAGTARASQDGYWSLRLAVPIAPGDHRLTIEQVDATGRVVASVESPFTRVAPETIRLRPGELHVTVQPGNSLWRIARATYGQGLLYTVIYSANAEKIRDPDLIYPGQVFVLPEQN